MRYAGLQKAVFIFASFFISLRIRSYSAAYGYAGLIYFSASNNLALCKIGSFNARDWCSEEAPWDPEAGEPAPGLWHPLLDWAPGAAAKGLHAVLRAKKMGKIGICRDIECATKWGK